MEKIKNGNKKLGVYILQVNNTVNLKYYYTLLKEGDFSNTNFKIVDFEEFKEKLTENKNRILKVIVKNRNTDFSRFLENLLKK